MNQRLRRFQHRLLALLLAFGGVSLLGVCADLNGPGERQRAHVAFQPEMPAAAVSALGSSSTVIDNVRIIIRKGDGVVVLDTVVTFAPGEDEVSLTADVPVHGESERFRATIQLRSGDVVLFEGTQDLDVRPGAQSGSPPTIPVEYVGTGSNAVSVTLAPSNLELVANGTQQLVATVRDGNGNVIPNVPLGWATSNGDVVTVSPEGLLTAGTLRGSAVITATTFGGIAGSVNTSVVLPPSEMRVGGGAGQSGPVTETLPLPFVVELVASDGVGIANATVAFSTTATGASVSPATATTDDNGRASAVMTLGTAAGPVTFGASSSGFTTSVTATALTGNVTQIVIQDGDAQSAFTGTTLPSPFSVRVTDEFGNPGADRQVAWTVVTAGSLASAVSTTNAEGIASNTFTLPAAVGTYAVTAALPGGTSVSFTATAIPRPAARLAVVSGGVQSGVAGSGAQTLVVGVFDDVDQPVAGATVTWTVDGSAIVGAPTSVTNANGIASVSAQFGTTTGISTITASIAGATSAEFSLTSHAGPPADIEIVDGNNQTGAPGNAVPIRPTVRVVDAFGNPVEGVQVAFVNASGGSFVVGDSVQVTDADGMASVPWTLGGLSPTQTLTATIGGGLNVTFTASLAVGAVASLVVNSGDGQIVQVSQAMQSMTVEAINFGETPVPGVAVKFTVLSGSATPTTTSVVTDANGRATFTPAAGVAGPGLVQACVMPACTITTTLSYTVIAGGSIWLGTSGSSWFTAANWSNGSVPGAADNVFIPAGTPNFPVLTAVGAVANDLFMASGALMDLGVFNLQIGGNVTTSNAFVVGSGAFVLSGASATITGALPNLQVAGTVTSGGTTNVFGNVLISEGGRLDIGAGQTTVSGGLTVDGAARLTMNNGSGTLTVNGDAFFGGQDMGDTEMTAGVLQVGGNFTAATFAQAFRATGTHVTRLSGTGLQTINFFQSDGAAGRFQNLEISNGSANGVTMSSNVFVQGSLQQAGRLTVPSPRDLTIIGTITLQAGSNTDVTGTISFGSCNDQGGAHTGFSCEVVTGPARLLRRRQ